MTDDPFVDHRSLLFTVAYGMLGSAADAEGAGAQSVTTGRGQALGPCLVGAIGLAEDAGQLGFLDADAPQDCGQGQSQACGQRQPVADGEPEPGHDQEQAGVGGVAYPSVGAIRDDGLTGIDLDRGAERPAECGDRPHADRQPQPPSVSESSIAAFGPIAEA